MFGLPLQGPINIPYTLHDTDFVIEFPSQCPINLPCMIDHQYKMQKMYVVKTQAIDCVYIGDI